MRLCEECSEETKDDKPFCSDHVEQMAYVVDLKAEFCRRGLCWDCGRRTKRGRLAIRCHACLRKVMAARTRARRRRPDWPAWKREQSRRWREQRAESASKGARVRFLCHGVPAGSESGEAWARLMAARVYGCSLDEDRALQAAWAESVRSEARARLMSREGAA